MLRFSICLLIAVTFLSAFADDNKTAKSLFYINGEVLSINDNGLLLSDVNMGELKTNSKGQYQLTEHGELVKPLTVKVKRLDILIFIKTNTDEYVDGMRYEGAVFEDGKIQYTAVSGANKTVLSFRDVKEILAKNK